MAWFWQKLLKTVFFFANLTFLWQKLLKTVFFERNSLVWQKYTEQLSQNGKLVQKDQDGKPVQKSQNGKFVRMREIDEL